MRGSTLTSIRIAFGVTLMVFNLSGQLAPDTVELRKLANKLEKGNYWSNKPDSLFIYATEGMKRASVIDDKTGIADMHRFLGLYYYWSGVDYTLAIENFSKAKNLYSELGREDDSYIVSNNLGLVYYKLGDYERALDYYYQASHYFEITENFDHLPRVLNNIGMIHKIFDDFPSAIKLYKQAFSIGQKTKDTLRMATYLLNLGNVYIELNMMDSAKYFHLQSLRLSESIRNQLGQIFSYNNLSKIFLQQGQYEESLRFARLGYSIAVEKGFKDQIGFGLINMANVKIKQKDYARANEYLLEALDVGKKSGFINIILASSKELSNCYRELGRFNEAFLYSDKYTHLKDSLYTKENATKLSNLRVLYEVDQKNTTIELLQKDKEISTLTRNLVASVSIGVLLLAAAAIFNLRQKIKKDKKLMDQRELLARSEKMYIEVELKQKETLAKKLEQEMNFKTREMELIVMNFVQKNEIIEEIKDVYLQIRNSLPEEIKTKINRLISSLAVLKGVDEERESLQVYLDQTSQAFLDNLKTNYPDLSPRDMKLCVLLRLNLDTKQIATILHITPESAKVTRHRIKKKMGLENDESLQEFLNSFASVRSLN